MWGQTEIFFKLDSFAYLAIWEGFMEKISVYDIRKKLQKCGIGYDGDSIEKTPYLGFCHVHEWDHGYDSYHGFCGTRRQFYADLFSSLSCLYDYFGERNMSSLIVAPCHNIKQFKTYIAQNDYEEDIICEALCFLKKYNIRKGTQWGAHIVADDKDTIAMVIEGAFRDALRFCLFSPEREFVVEGNHHFGITIWTQHVCREKEVLSKVLKNYPDLRYFEAEVDR